MPCNDDSGTRVLYNDPKWKLKCARHRDNTTIRAARVAGTVNCFGKIFCRVVAIYLGLCGVAGKRYCARAWSMEKVIFLEYGSEEIER